jgi:tetratricopeptide (TPR) repeat protein
MNKLRFLPLFVCLLLAATLCNAQSTQLDLPLPSQHAVVTQRIGVTDITINYHRPLANERKVWGGLVPYGQVWRAGANENTTITFTDPVTIEGKSLAAGTYGLHMIPNENEWTIIFSKMHTAWGSFSYDQAEDALRITVKPQATELHNALAYDFDQLQLDSTVVVMSWDKVAVPFKVAVNLPQTVEASLHNQLRGLSQYTWDAWDDAATYLVDNKMDLNEALKYEDKSIQNEERFENLMTKSRILDAMGQKDQATVARNKALGMANAQQLYGYARQLQRQKKQDEAFAIFRTLDKKYPDNWLAHAGMGRIYCGQGDYTKATEQMNLALSVAPDAGKSSVEGLIKRLEAKDDINK